MCLSACIHQGTPTARSVTIMTFNVENLFDNVDDPGKADGDYLPIELKQTAQHRATCGRLRFKSWQQRCLNIDWNDDIVARKLQAVAETILQVNNGHGPDIVALQEVENIGILERLRNEYLHDAGYLPGILLEGRDSRGIDVAFLSRLPLATAPQLHAITFDRRFAENAADTRGILQADFELPDGAVLTGFAVHFPAPYHPTEMRIAAYETLDRLLHALPDDHYVFAAGDFNTSSAEDQREHLLDRLARPQWIVSNDLCAGCKGTEYYASDRSWSFLDMILWHPCCGNNSTWDISTGSVHIANAIAEQKRPDGTPKRFEIPAGAGVSDHWPVVVTVHSF